MIRVAVQHQQRQVGLRRRPRPRPLGPLAAHHAVPTRHRRTEPQVAFVVVVVVIEARNFLGNFVVVVVVVVEATKLVRIRGQCCLEFPNEQVFPPPER